jgi:hypothetical protein
MRKYIFGFSFVRHSLKFFATAGFFIFYFSFCSAQDSIVFKSGEKDAVKILSFGKNKVKFSLDDTLYSVGQDRINIIKYQGVNYSFQQASAKFDSINKLQNAERDKHDSTDYRPININIGVGGSSIESLISANDGLLINQLGPYYVSQSPAYNFVIDYRFIRWLSVGVGAVYQSVTDNPSEEVPSNIYAVNPLETEKITRVNYTVRVLYHLLQHSTLDVYGGFRGGESMWAEQITSNTSPAGFTVYKTPVPASSIASLQFIVGGMFPVYHCLAVHAELGVGTPYVAEVGITLQIKTKR